MQSYQSFQRIELGVDFHPYQQEAFASLLSAYKQGSRCLHLVAPPGAGKTLMGLELILRLGQPAVILSPNTTIQSQWLNKFEQWAVILDEISGLKEKSSQWISKDARSGAAILSLTYQKVSVKADDGLHSNVELLFEDLQKQGYRTLVLDECHHLLAHWAKAVKRFSESLPESVLIGLTATPPVDRQAKELDRYLDLIGDVDFEIPAPAVIREGHLAPYQDLVYLVRPNEQEHRFVSGAHRRLHEVLRELEKLEEGLPSLSFWAENWLLNPCDPKGNYFDQREALIRMPDRSIACLRYLNAQGLTSLDLPWCPELEDPVELHDWTELLAGYGQEMLKTRLPERWNAICDALQVLGYRFERGKFVARQGSLDRVLAFSAAKLRGVEDILLSEIKSMGQDLRCLVLTDFETTHAPGKRKALEGVLDPEAGGALAVMRYFTSHSVLDTLDPILVTGSNLLCDDDLLPRFNAEAQNWISQKQLDIELQSKALDGFMQIIGRGRDWNSANYLALVTDMLEQEVTHCLIGTRGLLGEGWDCQALNTLIDLTSVTSYVSVNQIRGRSLRRDPRRPLKLANNWDVVSILPEMEGGFRDLERFEKKHRHFFGLSDDGQLEKGIGHVHPRFDAISRRELLQGMHSINQDMLKRSEERLRAYDAWKIGAPYRNKSLISLNIQSLQRPTHAEKQQVGRLQIRNLPVHQEQILMGLQIQSKRLKKRTLQVQLGMLLGGLFLGFISFWGALASYLMAQLGGGYWMWLQRRKLLRSPELSNSVPIPDFYVALTRVLVQAFQVDGASQSSLVPEVLQRTDGSLRVVLHGANESFAGLYMQAYRECLEPLTEQRYVLKYEQLQMQCSGGWMPQWQAHKQDTIYLPVPYYFARSREKAENFARAFAEHIAAGELLYTKRGAGKQEIQSLQRQRALWNRTRQIEIWE